MSEKRLSIVKHAFQFVNVNNADKIAIEDLLRLYRPEVYEYYQEILTGYRTTPELELEKKLLTKSLLNSRMLLRRRGFSFKLYNDAN